MPTDSLPLPAIEAIQQAIEGCLEKECNSYANEFIERAKSDETSDWQTLLQVFNFSFKPKDALAPYEPKGVSKHGRSMIPEDLTEVQLDALKATLDVVTDSEYRARVADVLWLRRRDATAARTAVRAYLESGINLEHPEHWVRCMERYERAIRIARQIEPKGELPKTALTHLESRVKEYDGNDPLFFTLKALELLVEFEFGDFAENAKIAGRIAERSRKGGNFERARKYYDVQAKLLRLAKDKNSAEVSRTAYAECFVEEAEAREVGGSFMAARSFWEDAVRAFRDRPSLRARVPELQKRLARAGKESLAEMQQFSHEVDIKGLVEKTTASFSGLILEDALCRLAIYLGPINPVQLREQTIEIIKESPLHALFSSEILDGSGRKVAHRPPISLTEEADTDPAIEHHMHVQASHHRGITVAACIAPAIRTILTEHEILEADIERLIFESDFIPEGRMPFFVKAILKGFQGDLSTSLHLFIPQAENSLRNLLERRGVLPRNMDKTGVEEVWRLDRILEHEVILEILGPPHVYEMQSLLTARTGPNIRNGMAHGLLSYAALNGETALYVWWLLYRLTLLPTSTLQAHIQREKVAEGRGTPS